jgi:uncharacterized protein YndB with AHSA1/START domain
MQYQASIDLAASPSNVFPFIADAKSRQEWMQKGFGARYTVMSTEYPNGFDESHAVGTKFVDVIARAFTKMETRYKGEILGYTKPTLFQFTTEVPYNAVSTAKDESDARTSTVVTFQLEPTGSGGTKLTWKMEDEGTKSFGLLNMVLKPMLQSYMNVALKALKKMTDKI